MSYFTVAPAADGQTNYVLGPVNISGNYLASAKAVRTAGSDAITIAFTKPYGQGFLTIAAIGLDREYQKNSTWASAS